LTPGSGGAYHLVVAAFGTPAARVLGERSNGRFQQRTSQRLFTAVTETHPFLHGCVSVLRRQPSAVPGCTTAKQYPLCRPTVEMGDRRDSRLFHV
jgi:hypothetical protein